MTETNQSCTIALTHNHGFGCTPIQAAFTTRVFAPTRGSEVGETDVQKEEFARVAAAAQMDIASVPGAHDLVPLVYFHAVEFCTVDSATHTLVLGLPPRSVATLLLWVGIEHDADLSAMQTHRQTIAPLLRLDDLLGRPGVGATPPNSRVGEVRPHRMAACFSLAGVYGMLGLYVSRMDCEAAVDSNNYNKNGSLSVETVAEARSRGALYAATPHAQCQKWEPGPSETLPPCRAVGMGVTFETIPGLNTDVNTKDVSEANSKLALATLRTTRAKAMLRSIQEADAFAKAQFEADVKARAREEEAARRASTYEELVPRVRDPQPPSEFGMADLAPPTSEAPAKAPHRGRRATNVVHPLPMARGSPLPRTTKCVIL